MKEKVQSLLLLATVSGGITAGAVGMICTNESIFNYDEAHSAYASGDIIGSNLLMADAGENSSRGLFNIEVSLALGAASVLNFVSLRRKLS